MVAFVNFFNKREMTCEFAALIAASWTL